MSILDDILAYKRDEVAALRRRRADLEAAADTALRPRRFAEAIGAGERMTVIAEIKRRSPSKGELAPDLDAATTAKQYAVGGAAALSVLTDQPSFGGSLADLQAARAATDLPALRKDFTLDPIQVVEARAAGADAVLLIVAALNDDGLLRALRETAEGLGMTALVEVDDDAGIDRAVGAGATVIGVTNRDLHTFAEDLSVGERLAARLPEATVKVAESAIRGPADAARMAAAGFHAVLVGEHLVRAPDAEAAVAELCVPRAAH